MFYSDVRNSRYAQKSVFLRRGSWLRPESRTPRPRIQNSGLMFKNSALYIGAYLLTYLALQPVFGLGLITKVTPFLSILR
jgi:hypothetical protein